MVPSCMRGLPLFQMVSLLYKHITAAKGPTHLKLTSKGQHMAYRQTHIGKTIYLYEISTYLSNFKPLNGLKHHFT